MVQVNAWSISSLAPRHETARSDSAQRFGSSSRAPTRAFPSNATASSGVSGQQGGTGQTRLIWQANGPPVASGSRTPAVCAHPKFDSVVLRTRGLNDQVSSGPRRDQGRALDSAGLRLPGKSEHGSPHLPAPKAKGKGRVWPTEPQTPPNQTPGTLGRVKTASHMPGSSPLQPLAASSLPSGSHTPSLPTTLSQVSLSLRTALYTYTASKHMTEYENSILIIVMIVVVRSVTQIRDSRLLHEATSQVR